MATKPLDHISGKSDVPPLVVDGAAEHVDESSRRGMHAPAAEQGDCHRVFTGNCAAVRNWDCLVARVALANWVVCCTSAVRPPSLKLRRTPAFASPVVRSLAGSASRSSARLTERRLVPGVGIEPTRAFWALR